MEKIFHAFCIGTADTKLEELLFLADNLRSHLTTFSQGSPPFKVQVSLVDVSTSNKKIECLEGIPLISREVILSCYFSDEEHLSYKLPEDRGNAIAVMSEALKCFLKKAYEDRILAGAIGLGGSGGTSLISPALRSLPLGVPKIIVSTVASGQTEPYIKTSDMILFPSVVDICGINSVSRLVLSNAGAAAAGMIVAKLLTSENSNHMDKKPTIGITMFGVTTPCVNSVKERLTNEGFETLVFHATGTGGKAMEELVREGLIQGPQFKLGVVGKWIPVPGYEKRSYDSISKEFNLAFLLSLVRAKSLSSTNSSFSRVLDITTTEVADYIVGGVMACDNTRFDAIMEKIFL